MSSSAAREATYDLGLLEQSAAKWRRSPALRLVYGDIYRAVATRLAPGRSLEVGAGIGVAKEFLPDLVTSDIVKTPYVDRAVSAYDLPATGERWGNIIAFDVLHHLRRPGDFLAGAAQVLEPEGRVILVEPAATAWGRCFYRLAHHEPCRPGAIAPPFVVEAGEGEFANMGMGWAMFERHRAATKAMLAGRGLALREVLYRDVWAYPSTGGFSRPALLPPAVLRVLLRGEARLPGWLRRKIGLRMVVVLSRMA